MKGLEGRVALVTGASRGIGRACALALAGEGCSVAVNYLGNKGKANEVARLARKAGGAAISVKADVANHAEVRKMASAIRKELGEVEILVSNAGIHQHLKTWELTPDDWGRVIGTNLTGIFNCANVFAPSMIERGWGRIVNVASMIAYTGTDHEIHYAASKGGAVSATKALALELAPHGVRVNAVAPGYIETDMLAFDSAAEREAFQAKVPMARFGKPSEVADVVVYLCSDRSSYITGQIIHVNGGIALY